MVKVSAVIPVYNTEKYIGQCIESLRNQSLSDIEIICVDDGSTDKSVEIIKLYQKDDNRIRIIQQENQYAGVARNNGMSKAKGKYVIFLDSDDFFELDMLEKMYKKAEKTDCDICFCDMDYYETDLGLFDKHEHCIHESSIPKKEYFSYMDVVENIYQISAPNPCALYRASFLKNENIKFEGTKRGNDLRFWGISIIAASRITIVNEQLYHYRMGHANHLQSMSNNLEITEQHTLEQIKAYLEEKQIYDDVKESFKELVMGNNYHILHSITNRKTYCKAYDLLIKNNKIVRYDGTEDRMIEDKRYQKMCLLKKMGKYGVYRIRLQHEKNKILEELRNHK